MCGKVVIIVYRNNEFTFTKPFVFVRGEDKIELHLCKEGLKCLLLLDEIRGKYDEFIFVSDFKNFEPLSRSAVDEETRNILSRNLPTQKLTPISSVYTLLSINLTRCSEENVFSDKVYLRFFSIGDNFSPDERKEYLGKWCDYKSGIIQAFCKLHHRYVRHMPYKDLSKKIRSVVAIHTVSQLRFLFADTDIL